MPKIDDFDPVGLSEYGQNVEPGNKRNVVSAGISSGIDDLQGLLYSGGAAVADAVGAKGARDWLNQRADINQYEAAINGRTDLERIEDQTLGSALPYAAYQVSKQVPNLVGALAAGAVVPEVAVPAVLARGGAMLPRALGGGGAAGRVAAAGTEAGAAFGARRAALETGQAFGKQVVGGLAFNEAQSVGSLYQAARDGGDEEAGLRAIAGSPLYALSETLPEAMLVGRFKGGSGFSGNLLSRAGKSAAVQGAAGATSEGLQNEMEIAYDGSMTDEQKTSARLNSIAAGGLVEGVFGALGGGTSGRRAGRSILQNGNPDQLQQAINVNPGSNLSTQEVINQSVGVVDQTKQQMEAARKSREADIIAALNEKTGQFVTDPKTGIERELTAGELANLQAGAVAQQNAQAGQQQAAQQQQQASEQQLKDREATLKKFGGAQPIPGVNNGFSFLGQNYFTPQDLAKAVDKIVAEEKAKPPHVLQTEDAITSAWMNNFSDKGPLSPSKLKGGQFARYLSGTQSIQDVIARIDADMKVMQGKKGKADQAKIGFLQNIRDNLTGENNEPQQTTTGMGAVPTAQPAAQPTGNVQPQQVQSVQPGDVAGGSVPVQNVQQGAPSAPAVGTNNLGLIAAQAPQVGATNETTTTQGVPTNTSTDSQGTPGTNAPVATQAQGNVQRSEEDKVAEQIWEEMDATGIPYSALPEEFKKAWSKAVKENKATGELQEQIAEVGRDATSAGTFHNIVEDILAQVIVRKGRMSNENLEKKRKFVAAYFGGARTDTLKKVAADLKISDYQARHWSAELPTFVADNEAAFGDAIKKTADKYKITPEEIIEEISRNAATVVDEVKEETQQTEIDERDLLTDEKGNSRGMGLTRKSNKVEKEQRDREDKVAESNTSEVKSIPVEDYLAEKQGKVGPHEYRGDDEEKYANHYTELMKAGKKPAAIVENTDYTREMALAAAAKENGWPMKTMEMDSVGPVRIVGVDKAALDRAVKAVEQMNKLGETQQTATELGRALGYSEADINAWHEYQATWDKPLYEFKPTKKVDADENDRYLWNQLAKKHGLPMYDELSPQAKADWMLSVNEKKTTLAAANKVFEANKDAFLMESGGKDKVTVGETTTVQEMAQKFPAIQKALDEFAILGITKALDAVDRFTVTTDADASDGAFQLEKDMTYRVTYREDVLAEGTSYSTHVFRHEIGHAVDMASHGGVYSGHQAFSMAIMDGELIPTGSVAREMYNLYKKNPNWKTFLEYPFDHIVYPRLTDNTKRIRNELFAQLFSAYTHPKLRARMQKEAPLTHKFMSEVIEDVRSEEAISSKTQATAERRALGFNLYNSARSAQAAQGIPGSQGKATGRAEDQSFESIRIGIDNLFNEAKDNISKLPPSLRAPVRTIHDVLFKAKELGLGLGITEDVARLGAKFMPSVKKFVEAQHQRMRMITERQEFLDKIMVDFQDLDKNTRKAVNKLIGESVILEEWAYDPSIQGAKVNKDLSQRFKAMPPKAQEIIRKVFTYGRTSLQEKKDAIRAKVEEAYPTTDGMPEEERNKNQKKKDEMLRKFATILNINSVNPYAPLKRFGSFVIVGKSPAYMDAVKTGKQSEIDKLKEDGNHYVVEFAETAGEAEEIYDRMVLKGGLDVERPFKKSAYKDALYSGTDLWKGFAKLQRVIANEKGVDKGNETLARLESMVNELYLLSLAESSARKSELQKKKVAGFNEDMMRAFFTQGSADAHYIAGLKTNDKIMDTIVAMQKEATANRGEAYPYLNELMGREAKQLEVREPSIFDNFNRLTGDFFLTFSPAFYFQQMTQTYVLSLPWLAGRYNYFKSSRMLMSVYKEILPLIKNTNLKEHIDFDKAPADVREMLKELVGKGRINIGLDAELAGYRTEGNNPVTETYNKTTNTLRGAINRIEATNRAVAAIAAYRLEMQKSGDKAKALAAADGVVYDTHGSYDGFNTPRLFGLNAVTRSISQFRRFQIIQLSMLTRLVHESVKGASATEKAMARKQLAYLMTHSFALAGVKGLPIYGLLSVGYSILNSLFGDDEDPEDFEAWLRSQGGLLLARGIPASLGVDVSGKLGLGNVMQLLPYTNIDLTSRSGLEKTALAALGPFAGGLLPKFADGLGFMAQGNYLRGLEQFTPVGISNGIKAIRFGTEGVTMRNGDVVMSPEDIGFMDLTFQAVGLPTITFSERQYRQQQTKTYDDFYESRAKEIKQKYSAAYRSNDTSAMQQARDDWENLQQSRVKNDYKRQPLSELLKAPAAQAKREKSVVSGVETNKGNRGFVERLGN